MQTGLDTNTIIHLLNELSERELILVKYFLRCANEDSDLVQEYEFYSDDDLFDFYRDNKGICPDCDEQLLSKDIRVAYQRKEIEFYEHE